jgi:hypothetical protein
LGENEIGKIKFGSEYHGKKVILKTYLLKGVVMEQIRLFAWAKMK